MIAAIITNIRMMMRRIIIICKAVKSPRSGSVGRALGLVPGRPGFESWPSHLSLRCVAVGKTHNQPKLQFLQL